MKTQFVMKQRRYQMMTMIDEMVVEVNQVVLVRNDVFVKGVACLQALHSMV
jgi:hypothetical protein